MIRIRRLMARVSNARGETMIETLVSVLISALSLLLLATAIGSSVNTIMTSTHYMESFYTDQSALVESAYSDDGEGSTIILDVPLSQTDGNTVNVKLYENKGDASIVLYKRDAS